MEQFETVIATFQPKVLHTLKPGCAPWIGKQGQWLASWIIEDGPYAGQWAMGIDIRDDTWRGFPAAWVPEEDLIINDANYSTGVVSP